MNKDQLIEAIENLPTNPIEWDTAILAKKIRSLFMALIDQAPSMIEVDNIQTLTKDQLDSLRVGDMVIKHTTEKYDSDLGKMVPCNLRHMYIVTYKGEDQGDGIVLTYSVAGYGETVSYDRTENGWAYNSTDKITYKTESVDSDYQQ